VFSRLPSDNNPVNLLIDNVSVTSSWSGLCGESVSTKPHPEALILKIDELSSPGLPAVNTFDVIAPAEAVKIIERFCAEHPADRE